MAFVFDHNDPSNLGMFSKPGRFTSEKYIIFQKKDEIINNQRKFLKVTALPHLKVDFDSKEQARTILDEEEEKPKVVHSTKARSIAAPFSQQQSREEYYEVKSVKRPAPPCGFYNPKYHYVERTPRTLFKYNKEKPKASFFSTMTDWSAEESSRPLPDKLKKKVVGPTSFSQQLPRPPLLSPANPHDERFTYLEFPKNCTKSKKLLSIDMRKTLPRDDKLMFKSLEYSPDYAPNFEAGKKRLGSCGAPFERGSPRKPMFHISPCSNENYVDQSTSENLKFSRTSDTFFNKYLDRTVDEKSPLPSFMQKSISSRLAVGTLRQKTLEINGFSEGRFQTIYSSFSPKKK